MKKSKNAGPGKTKINLHTSTTKHKLFSMVMTFLTATSHIASVQEGSRSIKVIEMYSWIFKLKSRTNENEKTECKGNKGLNGYFTSKLVRIVILQCKFQMDLSFRG